MIKDLPKRSEIKSKYRPQLSESQPEFELNYQLLRNGLRAEKQYPIGRYFVDLALPEYRLVIEYDGKIHLDNPVYDYKRHKEIENLGWHILRIMNKGGYYKITIDLENPDFISFPVSDDIYKKAVQVVKDFIRKQKMNRKDFVTAFASEEIKDTESFTGGNGFKSAGELLKGYKK